MKGTLSAQSRVAGDYYPRALALTSLAGIGRLPQITLPLADDESVPAGLSLLAGHGRDAFLLAVASEVAGVKCE